MRSLKDRKNDEITNFKILKILINTKCPFIKKGEKNPELSWYEKKLLFGWKKMRDYKAGVGFNKPIIGKDCTFSINYVTYPIGVATENISIGSVVDINGNVH